MDCFEVMAKRQSVHHYQPTQVEEEKLAKILEAANRAPSAGNLQAYAILVVKDPSLRQALDQASGGQGCVARAPCVLVFCTDPQRSSKKFGTRGEHLLCVQDATIACAYAQLAATTLGLSSIWIGALLDPEASQDALGIQENIWPVALLPIGYPVETPPRKPRRALQELVREVVPKQHAVLADSTRRAEAHGR